MKKQRNREALRTPLSARSVVASTLLGCHPPRLPAQALVRMGELFGIVEGTLRVALSRMVAAGELEAGDNSYCLTGGHLLRRQARQEEGWHPTLREWDGTWMMVVVVRGGRSAPERVELRAAMAALRLGELREGIWLRPDNLDPGRLPAARVVVDAQCRWFGTRPSGEDHGRHLAAELWDLSGWAKSAERLRRQMDQIVSRLEAGDHAALAPASLVSAAVVRHFVADPLLPAELLPTSWPADAMRAEYGRFEKALRRLLQAWIRHHQRQSP